MIWLTKYNSEREKKNERKAYGWLCVQRYAKMEHLSNRTSVVLALMKLDGSIKAYGRKLIVGQLSTTATEECTVYCWNVNM